MFCACLLALGRALAGADGNRAEGALPVYDAPEDEWQTNDSGCV